MFATSSNNGTSKREPISNPCKFSKPDLSRQSVCCHTLCYDTRASGLTPIFLVNMADGLAQKLAATDINNGSKDWQKNLKAPVKDSRVQTEDVTGTKGIEFDEMDIKRPLMAGIYEAGFENPSPIQEAAIPVALTGRDILARAKNGTGKTGAFTIPTLEKIDPKASAIQALILVPTRELCFQHSQVCKTLGKYLNLQVMVSTGGTNLRDDIVRLDQTVHIVVGTPGRIVDLASKGIADLSQCSTFVMDEADKLLSPEFTPQVEQLLRLCAPERQIMLFSATFPLAVKEFKVSVSSAMSGDLCSQEKRISI